MSWLGLDRLFLGTDLSAEEARGRAADAQLNRLNQRAVDEGYHTQDYATNAAADITQANSGYWQDTESGAVFVTDNHGTDPTAAVDQAFVEGAQQGLQNVLHAPGAVVGAIGSGAGTVLWGILKKIPWWVYLAGLFAIFVWMGGLVLLRGRLARR